MPADRQAYLRPLTETLARAWPDNRTVNLVFHGHSIPAGYTANHVVQPFDAYPHLLHQALHRRFPCAVLNCIISAIGGEDAARGAKRFQKEALVHRPDVVIIDYAINDRFIPFDATEAGWRSMIEQALACGVSVLLVTPLPDCGRVYWEDGALLTPLPRLIEMIRGLADEYAIGLADANAAYEHEQQMGKQADDFLLSVNHPNREGHMLVVRELLKYFPL